MIAPCHFCGIGFKTERRRVFCSRACYARSRRRLRPEGERLFEAMWREGDRLREIAARMGLPMGTAATYSARLECPARIRREAARVIAALILALAAWLYAILGANDPGDAEDGA